MLRYIGKVMCTVNSTHDICTDAGSPSCIRSVQAHSMQWTPLVVHFKGVHNRIIFKPPPKCRTRQDGDVGMSRVAHVAAMLVGCSPLSENLVRTTLFLPRSLHWLNILCCTGCRDRSRHLLRMDKNSTLTMLTFSRSRGS